MTALPTQADVVVVGGGIVGCSVLYHLAKAGFPNCVLLERYAITSGTTWHSAALVTPLRSSAAGTELAKYSARLYADLERETGQATGWRNSGRVDLAASKERLDSLQYTMTAARSYGIDVEFLAPGEIAERWPLLRADDLHGGLWMPSAGRVSPTDVCQALLKGAKAEGAKVFEQTPVVEFDIRDGRIRGVVTAQGRIACDAVVNCTGLWGRDVAAMAKVTAPLYACEHFYLLTEPMAGVTADLPVIRDGDARLYIREEVGGLLVGCFEPNPRPLPVKKIPDIPFALMGEDWDHFEPMMENAIHRVPDLETAGARSLINGPESFTLDHNPIMGESPEVAGFFMAAGMNSSGVAAAGGVGWAMAQWVKNGEAPLDLWDSDIRRFSPHQNNERSLFERIPEVLSEHFAISWPGKAYKTVRDLRRTPLFHLHRQAGAHFGQRVGWERPEWFGQDDALKSSSDIAYRYGRPAWFENWRNEHDQCRNDVALFDQSPFSKILVQGRHAECLLDRVCSNSMQVAPGRIVYTQMLNRHGGMESDFTVSRLSSDEFLVVTGSSQGRRDLDWLRRSIRDDERVAVTDISSSYAVLAIAGPNSRELLSAVTSADLSNEAFPFYTRQELDIGYVSAQAMRLSFTGELGWEIYVPTESAESVTEALIAAAGTKRLFAGSHALNSLRQEKGFRVWGHDIGPMETPIEAGLAFAVDFGKADFTGKDALRRQREHGYDKRLVNFIFDDAAAFPYGHEPIYRNGERCGSLASVTFGHTIGHAVGFGWVKGKGCDQRGWLDATFEIEVAGVRYPATAGLHAAYDPKGLRARA